MATKSETNFIGPKNHMALRRSYQLRCCYIRALAGSDAIQRLVQLLCGSTITRSVRDEDLATWEQTRGARKGSERKQLGEGKRAFAYGKFSLSPTMYQRCIMTLQKITSDSEFTAYLVDVAEAFDKTSQSR